MSEQHGQARHTDPATSHAAAAAISPQALRVRLLQAFCLGGPQTDEQAAGEAGLLHTEYATRCSELRAEGLLVVVGGVTRAGTSGRQRMMSVTTHAGAAASGLPGALRVPPFPGTVAQASDNVGTHTWGPDSFCECGARWGGTLATWPCGYPVPTTVEVLL